MSDDINLDVEKEIDVDIEFDLDSNVDIDFKKDVDIKVDVDSDVDVKGNFASATFSVVALGKDTLAEADVHVLVVEDKLSSVDGSLVAAA